MWGQPPSAVQSSNAQRAMSGAERFGIEPVHLPLVHLIYGRNTPAAFAASPSLEE